jgi:thiol-disulfide isomerase/thioredoxin
MRQRLFISVLLMMSLLSGCSSNSTKSGPNELGFVSADGTAVLHNADQRGDAGTLTFPGIAPTSAWSLSDARGKVVLLNIWGPWCAPCRKEFPELETLSTSLAPDGLEVVGVATRTTATSVQAFVESQAITFRQVADFDSLVISDLRGVPSSTVPSSILIDRKGRIAGWVLGAADPVLLKSMLKSLLEEAA